MLVFDQEWRGDLVADDDVGQLWRNGVDDLAKYRIVEHLWRNPHTAGDVTYFVKQLGFHSYERTQLVLDELVSSGLLDEHDCDGAHFYVIAAGEVIRRRLADVLDQTGSPSYESLVRRLANRSLNKTRAFSRRRKHTVSA